MDFLRHSLQSKLNLIYFAPCRLAAKSTRDKKAPEVKKVVPSRSESPLRKRSTSPLKSKTATKRQSGRGHSDDSSEDDEDNVKSLRRNSSSKGRDGHEDREAKDTGKAKGRFYEISRQNKSSRYYSGAFLSAQLCLHCFFA